MQYNWQSEHIREHDFPEICNTLGTPVTFDAAQLGAYAHRLRNYWQNMAPPSWVANAIAGTQRVGELQVDDILDTGRHSNAVQRKDWHPMYPANVPGQPRSALPTLVAYPASRAFRVYRDDAGAITSVGPGCVYDSGLGGWTEPNPDEREAAVGSAVLSHNTRSIVGYASWPTNIVAWTPACEISWVWDMGGTWVGVHV
jgi:hypothetical protein